MSELSLLRDAAGVSDDDGLLTARELHFEWQDLQALPDLELVSTVSTLYAQHNLLSSLQPIADALVRLERLYVQSNALVSLAPLKSCLRLVVLDARDNRIFGGAHDVAQTLPRSLRTLSLSGNACFGDASYADILRAELPDLRLLDGAPVGEDANAARLVAIAPDAKAPSSDADALAEAITAIAEARRCAVDRSRARVAQDIGEAPTSGAAGRQGSTTQLNY